MRSKWNGRALVLSVAFSVMFAMGAASAHADSLTLGICNTPCTIGTGPYATVTLSGGGTNTLHVVFEAASGFGFVDGGSVDLNLSNTGVTTKNVVVTPVSGFSAEALTFGTGNADGFGSFNLNGSMGDSKNPASKIEFDVVLGSGTWTGLAASDLTGTNQGYLAAAHVAVLGDEPRATGYAANGTTSVPEPSTLLLLGFGIAASGVLGRRWFRSQSRETKV